MKNAVCCLAALMLAASVFAEEESCPAAVAEQMGFSPIGAFHHAVMPLWHSAWPEKDMQALIEGAGAFDSLIGAIADLKPVIGNEGRLKRFEKYREELRKAVSKYSKAAGANDSEAVYELLPGLHDSFEEMAAALAPTPFSYFEGLVVTSDLILNKHLPDQDMDAIIGSTETLVMKLGAADSADIPDELKGKKKEIALSFATMAKTASKMKKSCDERKMKEFSTHASEFAELLKKFSAEFL